LLGLAFPARASRKAQRFYVNYTDLSGNTVIAQYRVLRMRTWRTRTGEIILLPDQSTVCESQRRSASLRSGRLPVYRNGRRRIGRRPAGGNGQNRQALLGKMLRVDVESDPGRIRIPPDNPFANQPGTRGEIWALGLRNPWRFTFDRATKDLWIADVGQDKYEEIDFQPSSSRGGENYGWNPMEGLHCFVTGCNPAGLTLPDFEYPHNPECSVTGGFVYRGRGSPGLRGLYLYGDLCSGKIWGLERQGSNWVNRLLLSSGFSITTFGEDEAGEMYVAHAGNSTVYRISGSAAPRVTVAGAVNAASFLPGLVSGSLVTQFAAGVRDDAGIDSAVAVPFALSLGGVSITLNGTAVPIRAVANVNGQEQVNFQVPFGLTGSTVSLVVSRDGRSSAAIDVPLLDAQPGVYTTDGTQAIVVHNTDFTLATAARPLDRNEYAFVYAAGLDA
jgi:hypothetical protein